MGNAAIRDVAAIEATTQAALAGETFAIDAHNWLYAYMGGLGYWMDEEVYTTDDGEEVLNLVACLRGLPTLLGNDVTPLFVFDGTPDDRKADEIERRRDARRDAEDRLETARDEGDTEAIRRLKTQTQRLTPTVHETTRHLFDLAGVPYVEAPAAGEAQAAKLVRDGHADAVLSEDYDALLFGSPRTVRNYSGSGAPELMSFDRTLAAHDFTHRQLVDFALLLGTDYNDGVYGIGKKRGLAGLKRHGDIETTLGDSEKRVEDLDALRQLFLDPAVESMTPETTVRTPDFDAIYEYTVEQWEIAEDRVREELDRLRGATTD